MNPPFELRYPWAFRLLLMLLTALFWAAWGVTVNTNMLPDVPVTFFIGVVWCSFPVYFVIVSFRFVVLVTDDAIYHREWGEGRRLGWSGVTSIRVTEESGGYQSPPRTRIEIAGDGDWDNGRIEINWLRYQLAPLLRVLSERFPEKFVHGSSPRCAAGSH